MHPAERSPSRTALGAAALIVLGALASLGACGIGRGAQDEAIEHLAIGTWACAPDGPGRGELPFTVTIDRKGTFTVTTDDQGGSEHLGGTWSIEDGDLEWGFTGIPNAMAEQRIRVLGFDQLSPESSSFELTDPGMFQQEDDDLDTAEGVKDTQKVLTDAHGTDSVTLRLPKGKPWTCDRQ